MPEPRRAADTPRTEYPAHRTNGGKFWAKWRGVAGMLAVVTAGLAWGVKAYGDHEIRHVNTENTQRQVLEKVDQLAAGQKDMTRTLLKIQIKLGVE